MSILCLDHTFIANFSVGKSVITKGKSEVSNSIACITSSLSTPSGIRKARQNMRAKIAKTLEGATGKEMSEADVDKFLDIAKYYNLIYFGLLKIDKLNYLNF